jgi:hypothetical protein
MQVTTELFCLQGFFSKYLRERRDVIAISSNVFHSQKVVKVKNDNIPLSVFCWKDNFNN